MSPYGIEGKYFLAVKSFFGDKTEYKKLSTIKKHKGSAITTSFNGILDSSTPTRTAIKSE